MTIQEYFGDWTKVIPLSEADRIMKALNHASYPVFPPVNQIFKAFTLCPLRSLKVVILTTAPYPSSLDSLTESVIDFTRPHNFTTFDPSLEKWESQGVLPISAALSLQADNGTPHLTLWKPFITTLLRNLSHYDTALVYVLIGASAQSLEHCINPRFNHIIKTDCPTPALWNRVNTLLTGIYGSPIQWH